MDINELQYSTLTDENGVPIIYARGYQYKWTYH